MTQLYYATSNPYKFEAARSYFRIHCPDISLIQLPFEASERQTHDQQAISQEKAYAAWCHIQAPVIADDAGVYFEAYNNFPGFMTRFVWEALGTAGMLKLVEHNNQVTQKVFITYCNGKNDIHTVQGSVTGRLVSPEIPVPSDSTKPFLYLVIPNGYEKPFMSLPLEEQNENTSFRLNGKSALLTGIPLHAQSNQIIKTNQPFLRQQQATISKERAPHRCAWWCISSIVVCLLRIASRALSSGRKSSAIITRPFYLEMSTRYILLLSTREVIY